jgi:hypothetical protein
MKSLTDLGGIMNHGKISIDEFVKSKSALYIAPISWGLGDLVISLPVIQALVDQGVSTYLVVHSRLHVGLAQRMTGLKGVITEDEYQRLDLLHSYVNLREHPLQQELWWGSLQYYEKFADKRINDLLSTICSDFGIAANLNKLIPLAINRKDLGPRTIIFIPGSDGDFKCWPTSHWLVVADILRDAGWRVIVLGQPDVSKAVIELIGKIEWFDTPGICDALDIISSGCGVIGVDTGLMHLAAHQLIPTIGLFRQRPVYWRPYEHCFKVEAAFPCDQACHAAALACSNQDITSFVDYQPQSWSCARLDEANCMQSLSPYHVVDVFHQQEFFFTKNSPALM